MSESLWRTLCICASRAWSLPLLTCELSLNFGMLRSSTCCGSSGVSCAFGCHILIYEFLTSVQL